MGVNRSLVLGEKVFTDVGVCQLIKISDKWVSDLYGEEYKELVYSVETKEGEMRETHCVWHKERLEWELRSLEKQVDRLKNALGIMDE